MSEPKFPKVVFTASPKDKLQKEIERFSVTAEKVKEVEESVSLWHDTIFHQKWNVLIGEPGSGKTALAIQAAADITAQGFDVLYFNLDAGAADLKHYQQHAEKHGYTLLAAMDVGQSDEQLAELLEMHKEDADLSNTVFFLDTLKKFTDPLNKAVCKPFYRSLRKLTMQGGTVVCLGHTNKYRDDDGKLIYEGSGDLKSDSDVMALLYQVKNDDGSMSISTEFEKGRALVQRNTFHLSAEREVSLAGEWRDVREESQQGKQEAADRPVIDFIRDKLWGKPLNQSEVVSLCSASGMGGRRSILRILKGYDGRYWQSQRSYEHNEKVYGIDGSA